MNWITIAILLGIVFVLAVVFGSKASAPSLFEGVLFLMGFGLVVLVSTERWIDWINWIVNNIRLLFGMANEKFDFSQTISALKSGEISRTTAGTITITCVLGVLALRMVTSLLALAAGILLGVVVKVWLKFYSIELGGII